MIQASQPIEQFFRIFETNAMSDDIQATVSQFAEVFMAASPQGAQVVRASDFGAALPKRKQMFAALGCRSTELVGLTENRLDARFVMASTRWKMTFVRPGSETQDVLADSVYIVDTHGDEPKIVFYLANQDVMEVLRERGILVA